MLSSSERGLRGWAWGATLVALLLQAVPAGAFTEEDVAHGRARFEERCQRCHTTGDSPTAAQAGGSLTAASARENMARHGEEFSREGTAAGLFRFIFSQMPKDKPGSLSEHDAMEVTSFVLDVNGIAPNGHTVSRDDLDGIHLRPALVPSPFRKGAFVGGGVLLGIAVVSVVVRLARRSRSGGRI